MKIKKLITLLALVSTASLLCCPIKATPLETENVSLYDFLKSTDEIQTSYNYPSMGQIEKTPEKVSVKSVLPSHTPITIRSVKTISARDVHSGETVNFTVASDVKDNNGNILVKNGTPVTAAITFAKNKEMIGRSGELAINDFHTNATDGSYVPLSGTLSSKPDDKMTLSIVLSVLVCPLFLLMKGEDAQVQAGTTKTVYTVSDVYIEQ